MLKLQSVIIKSQVRFQYNIQNYLEDIIKHNIPLQYYYLKREIIILTSLAEIYPDRVLVVSYS